MDDSFPNIAYFGDRSVDPGPDAEVFLGQTEFAICLAGFDPQQPIVVRIAWPDGQSSETELPSDERVLVWEALPGMPLGRYVVTAEQGALRAIGSITVSRPTRGLIGVVDGIRRIGEPFRLALAGFRPNRRVEIAIYRLKGRGLCPGQRTRRDDSVPYCLTTKRFRVWVDDNGEALAEYVVTRPRYRPGSYLFSALDRGRQTFSWFFEVCPRSSANPFCSG